MEAESIPQAAREWIDRIATADLMVGVLADRGGALSISVVRQALEKLREIPRTVVIQGRGPESQDGKGAPDAASAFAPPENDPVFFVPWTLLGPNSSIAPFENMASAYLSVLAAGDKLGVRAACVLASDLQTLTSQWISRLVQPVLQLDFDLVTPCYAHGKFDGLLNDSLLSPLTRALYGARIQNPLGPDLGISRRLYQRIIGLDQGARPAQRAQAPTSIAATAVCSSFKICQAHVGVRLYPPIDWTNLSSVLVQVLGPFFLDVERNAACWQRPRESLYTPSFGERMTVPEDQAAALDVGRMLELFRLGTRDLLEVWSLVLPPAILFELRKLSSLPPEQFRMPDELWARAVYDFALGHRLRTMNRDHLLRAMTPLYLGWLASYALEMQNAAASAAEQRIERLCQAFEATRPYLVSRWRWPDRFNP